jgi:WD40 repeat protein
LLGWVCLPPELHAKTNVAEVATLPTSSPVTMFALAQSGHVGAGVCKDGILRVWALPEGRLTHTVNPGTNQLIWTSFSRDGRLLQASAWSGDVTVWDTASGSEIFHLQVPYYTSAAAFSRDNHFLALATSFGPVQVVELAGSRRRFQLETVTGGVQAVAFSPDGTRIATADSDTQVRVYEAQTGKRVASQEEFLMDPLSIDFTADGKEIVAAGADMQAVFFDAATGRVTRRLKKQSHPVNYVEVSREGQAVATVLFDPASYSLPAPVLIWDTGSGRKLDQWLPPSGVVAGAWTPEGHFIAATLTPDAVHLWRVY